MFKSTDKDKIFEDLIKDLQPITRKSIERNFGTASKKKGDHVISFQYKGYNVEVELK
jgi:hypothetical protein